MKLASVVSHSNYLPQMPKNIMLWDLKNFYFLKQRKHFELTWLFQHEASQSLCGFSLRSVPKPYFSLICLLQVVLGLPITLEILSLGFVNLGFAAAASRVEGKGGSRAPSLIKHNTSPCSGTAEMVLACHTTENIPAFGFGSSHASSPRGSAAAPRCQRREAAWVLRAGLGAQCEHRDFFFCYYLIFFARFLRKQGLCLCLLLPSCSPLSSAFIFASC